MIVTHDTKAHRFVLSFPEGEAVLEYELRGSVVNFTHTLVPHELRGRGLAETLVRAGLAWAKGEGLTREASCTYVQRFVERYPDLG